MLAHTTADGTAAVRLTEVEAYEGVGEDPGSHAHRGPGRRNATMFGPAGHLYAYFTYGMHTCVNVTCRGSGKAAAVLLRAGEVVEGLELVRSRRTTSRSDADLAQGPARLAVALGIALAEDGADLLASGGAFALRTGTAAEVRTGPRVGVAGEGGSDAYPWRFWIPGERSVSQYRRAVTRRPAVRSG